MRCTYLSLFLLVSLAVPPARAANPGGEFRCSESMLLVDLKFEFPPVAASFALPESAWDLVINPDLVALPATRSTLSRFEGPGHPIPNAGDLIGPLKGDTTFREVLDYTGRSEEAENWEFLKASFAIDAGSSLLKTAFGMLDFLRDYSRAHILCMRRMSAILESDSRIAQLERLQHRQDRDSLMVTIISHRQFPVYQVINSYLHYVRTQAEAAESVVLPPGIRSRRIDYPLSQNSFFNTGVNIEISAPGRPLSPGVTDEKEHQLLGRIALFAVDRASNLGFGTIVARRQGKDSAEIDILDEVNHRLHTLHGNYRAFLTVEPMPAAK